MGKVRRKMMKLRTTPQNIMIYRLGLKKNIQSDYDIYEVIKIYLNNNHSIIFTKKKILHIENPYFYLSIA